MSNDKNQMTPPADRSMSVRAVALPSQGLSLLNTQILSILVLIIGLVLIITNAALNA